MSDSLWPYGLWPARLLCPGILQERVLERVAMPSSFYILVAYVFYNWRFVPLNLLHLHLNLVWLLQLCSMIWNQGACTSSFVLFQDCFGYSGVFCISIQILELLSFPRGSEVKVSACNVGDLGSIPGSGRSPGEGNGDPFQYSCMENSMDWRAWWATVHRVAKSRTRLNNFAFTLEIFVLILWIMPLIFW